MMIQIAIAIGLFVASYSPNTYTTELVHAEEPSYAKWSRLAIQQAAANYPNASIIDYLYIGSQSEKDMTVATFRLWMREDTREYGVIVRVTYVTESENIQSITFQEIMPP